MIDCSQNYQDFIGLKTDSTLCYRSQQRIDYYTSKKKTKEDDFNGRDTSPPSSSNIIYTSRLTHYLAQHFMKLFTLSPYMIYIPLWRHAEYHNHQRKVMSSTYLSPSSFSMGA